MPPAGPSALTVGGLQLVAWTRDDGLVHVHCAGEVVVADLQPQSEPLARLLGPGAYQCRVLLNLEKTEFLDTSGVTWLIHCHDSFEKQGGRLVLHSIPIQARNVLRLLHLDKILHMAADPECARAIALRDLT